MGVCASAGIHTIIQPDATQLQPSCSDLAQAMDTHTHLITNPILYQLLELAHCSCTAEACLDNLIIVMVVY